MLQRLDSERHSRDGHDEDPRVLPAHDLARRRIAQAVAGMGALEQETEALAQKSSSFSTASTTRSTDGMYASSICQYG